jgi:hypothetical protein
MSLLAPMLLAILLPVLCLGPGFFVLRHIRLNSSEKLCASIGLSVFLIYVAATAIYLANLSWAWCWLASAAGFALTVLSWPQLVRLLSKKNIQRQLGGFGLLLVTGFLMLCLIQHYSGGAWAGDWLEHYQRAQFFRNRQPLETLFIQQYPLPARPPLMNLVAAYFLSHIGDRYDLFQLIFLFLNMLVLFPCVLIASFWAGMAAAVRG